MKNQLLCFCAAALAASILIAPVPAARARMEWEVLKTVDLDVEPDDITIAKDGATAYILAGPRVLVFSLQANRVTDTIALEDSFTRVALSPDGSRLILAGARTKKLSIIELSEVFDIAAGASPIIGRPDAAVTLVAFLDYQCPYCARVYPVLEQLIEKYPNDVRLVIKHFPLRMHKFARNASLAALAASRQKKYREMTRVLFKNFSKLNDETLKRHAADIGLDMERFQKDRLDGAVAELIQQDLQSGKRVKVRGVPALFINGVRAKRRSINDLSRMVEKELKRKQ